MVLRALVVIQIAWIALMGAVVRDAMAIPPAWAQHAIILGFYSAMIGFPAAVSFALRRASLPHWKRRVVVGVEVALVATSLLAALPAVQ